MSAPLEQASALASILLERHRQNEKWGEQNHGLPLWITILMEEVGEFAQTALHKQFNGHKALFVRDEAVQVAAVALAIIECLDRNTPPT